MTIKMKCTFLSVALLFFLGSNFVQSRISDVARSTRFTCSGRPSGYYADVDTGCQVYHMCDGLGRQFSYSCPNTTLFQQRMLICDHWYMVNCSRSQSDYDANLLIGQRDKPFVSEAEMQLRTPRPDILSVPPNNNYYDGLKEAESKFSIHPGNSIVGVADTISHADNNGLDSAKQPYRPPASWSTGTKRPANNREPDIHTDGSDIDRGSDVSSIDDAARPDHDSLTGAASQDPTPTFRPIHNENTQFTSNTITQPNQELVPPTAPRSITTDSTDSEEFQIDARMKSQNTDSVVNFINRFDPNSADIDSTARTTSEIISINQQLPVGSDISVEEERTPRKIKNLGNNINSLKESRNKNTATNTRFDTINLKPTLDFETLQRKSDVESTVRVPEKVLIPPKVNNSDIASTTMGPPVYYEWKWAVPAFEFEPPKQTNETQNIQSRSTVEGKSPRKNPFSHVTRPIPKEVEVVPSNTEYNVSSYFVPDYVFPLDNPHPGYENDEAQTSFQVKVARPGRASYGENPACPHCHPAYLTPGTCEPCIVKR